VTVRLSASRIGGAVPAPPVAAKAAAA
jgi:hypothetical protein